MKPQKHNKVRSISKKFIKKSLCRTKKSSSSFVASILRNLTIAMKVNHVEKSENDYRKLFRLPFSFDF